MGQPVLAVVGCAHALARPHSRGKRHGYSRQWLFETRNPAKSHEDRTRSERGDPHCARHARRVRVRSLPRWRWRRPRSLILQRIGDPGVLPPKTPPSLTAFPTPSSILSSSAPEARACAPRLRRHQTLAPPCSQNCIPPPPTPELHRVAWPRHWPMSKKTAGSGTLSTPSKVAITS